MADEPNFGTLVTDAPSLEAPGWDTPFRFVVFGDFTGRPARDAIEAPAEIAERKGKKIDRENFDEVLAEFEVAVSIPQKKGSIELTFASLEDFHPDRIVARVEKFEDCSNAKEKSVLLSEILHHPNFRAVESTWLGVDWLLRKAWKSDNGIEVVIYDLAQEELAACANADDDLSQSVLYQWLVEKAQKGYNAQPWGAVLGLYPFAMTVEYAQVLGRIARVARHASAPFLAACSEKVWDKAFKPSADNAAAWQKLRELPESYMLGLATPGFLLRPPFGSGTKPIDSFPYEEYKAVKDQANYVWGNPALACAALLAKSFTKKNWNFKPGTDLDLDQIATHVARDEDNEEVLMTLQTWMLQPALDKVIRQGLMPLQGVKGRPEIRVAKFLPLAAPPKDQPSCDLVGSWGQRALKGVPRSPTKAPIRTAAAEMSPPDEETVTTTAEESKPGKKAGGKKTSTASSKGFDLHNMDDVLASINEFEAEQKKLQEEASGGSSDSDSGSMDMPSDDMPSDTPAEDPELAALMADADSPPADAPAADDGAMDPELAALMAEMDGGAPAEAPAEAAPAADTEMDPELAALLKEMEGGAS